MLQRGTQGPDSQTWQQTESFSQCEGQVEDGPSDTLRGVTLHHHPRLAGIRCIIYAV